MNNQDKVILKETNLDDIKTTDTVMYGLDGNQKIQQEVKYPLAGGEDKIDLDTFDPEYDSLADRDRDELLEELGKSGIEKVKGKVIVDTVSGERISSNRMSDIDDGIAAIQDLNPDEIRRQLDDATRKNLMLLLGDSISEEKANQVIAELEVKLDNVSKEEISEMTSDEVKQFVGDYLYKGIKDQNINPSKVAKRFLIDLKDSFVEVRGIIDTLDEINKSMNFFKRSNIDDLQNEIRDDLDQEEKENEGAFETEMHKYIEYLSRYTQKLREHGEYPNKFLEEEVNICEMKKLAAQEALTFNRVINKTHNIFTKIQKDFKRPKVAEKSIIEFIEKINNDPDLVISFPLPKVHQNEMTTKDLVAVWILFMEVVDMQRKFPELVNITHPEYFEMTQLVLGRDEPLRNKDGSIGEGHQKLLDLVHSLGITASHINDSKRMGLVLSYILSKTFKPSRINETYTRYVLSYTMNILSQSSLVPGYRKLTHELLDTITMILNGAYASGTE